MMKLTSRKFWISVAAFTGSVAAGIAGVANNNDVLAVTGTVCGILSAAIYAACEAAVDCKAAGGFPELEAYEEDGYEEDQ